MCLKDVEGEKSSMKGARSTCKDRILAFPLTNESEFICQRGLWLERRNASECLNARRRPDGTIRFHRKQTEDLRVFDLTCHMSLYKGRFFPTTM